MAVLPAIIDAAADLLIHALGHDAAKDKLAERALILGARLAADQRAAAKFGEQPKP
jgi:hypothetical protein